MMKADKKQLRILLHNFLNEEKLRKLKNFIESYEARLKHWHDLRFELEQSELLEKCVEIDKFWQQCPVLNHYLHPIDMETWPNPWQLLHENSYCVYARALGMLYTLISLGINEFGSYQQILMTVYDTYNTFDIHFIR